MYLENLNLCRCCSGESKIIFSGVLIGNQVDYFECSNCGYVSTEAPFWLDEAYQEAINNSDTGIMARNQINARIAFLTMLLLGEKDGTLVDCAGG